MKQTLITSWIALVMISLVWFLTTYKRTPSKPDHYVLTNNWMTVPLVNIIGGSTIDASRGVEFVMALYRDTAIAIINIRDGQYVNLLVMNTDFTLTFTNQITWKPRNLVPKADTNANTMFYFMRWGGELFGSVSRQTTLTVTNTGAFTFEFPTGEPEFSQVREAIMEDTETGVFWRYRAGKWTRYLAK